MSTIAQLVRDISAAPAPVLLLDTCSILDIARAPARNLADSVPAADSLVRLSRHDPPAVYLLVADLVGREWADNLASARRDAVQAVATHTHVGTVATSTGIVSFPLPPPQLSQLPYELEQRSRDLLQARTVIDRDPAATAAVTDRILAKRKPWRDRDGRAVKDCLIVEHYLALSRGLAAVAFAKWIVFISSNTTDFAESATGALHPDLAADFTPAGLRYGVSAGAATNDLRTAGQIP